MDITSDPLRLLAAAGVGIAYAGLCLASAAAQRRKRRQAAALEPAPADSPAWLVAYASQTGTAEELAWQTANTLHLAGVSAHLCPLAEIGPDDLRRAERILFIASTCGEGDAPDNAAAFVRRVMGGDLPLGHLHYGLLALGDRSYRHFCGFGRSLDGWLRRQGAQPLFEAIQVDRCDGAALTDWRQRLGHLAGTGDLPDWDAPAFADWRLAERRLLNPGSTGEPAYHLELEPAGGAPLPSWQSGDLAQVLPPGDPERPRDYSIASLPGDGRLHLLVRRQRRPDGSPGLASGWLTEEAALGETVPLRLRPHRLFRLGDNAAAPLVLIGNGTGLAGLRGHLKARAESGAGPNWLIFGERNADRDFHYQDEIEAWREAGVLAHLDLAFSRDQARRHYVQDRLREAGERLREWVKRGAAIYVCGSLEGMAAGVHQVLEEVLGLEAVEALAVAGRYRRDVY